MNQPSDIQIAKTVIANQQILIQRLNDQTQLLYAVSPDNQLVHIACGQPGINFLDDVGAVERICSCFKPSE